MKLLLPIVCSLLLIGCSDSTTSEAPIASQNEVQASSASDTGPAEANVQTEAPIAVETPKEAPNRLILQNQKKLLHRLQNRRLPQKPPSTPVQSLPKNVPLATEQTQKNRHWENLKLLLISASSRSKMPFTDTKTEPMEKR